MSNEWRSFIIKEVFYAKALYCLARGRSLVATTIFSRTIDTRAVFIWHNPVTPFGRRD
jgi:hypothetical protein